jgi:hypothetical protein
MQSTGFHPHSYNKQDPVAVLFKNQPHAKRCTRSTTSDLSTTPLLKTQLFLVFQIAQTKASQTIEKHFLRRLFDPHPTNTAYDIGKKGGSTKTTPSHLHKLYQIAAVILQCKNIYSILTYINMQLYFIFS